MDGEECLSLSLFRKVEVSVKTQLLKPLSSSLLLLFSHVIATPLSSSKSSSSGLPAQVNIDHFTNDVTLRNLVDLSSATFDLAQKRIFALMEKDSFGRFLRAELYQELLEN